MERGPKFCNTICADEYFKATGTSGRPGRPVGYNPDKPHEVVAKKLAFDELYDPIRDLMREEVRNTIGQRVRDNVLGMTELLTDLLPMVLAGLARDVQSEDVFVRQKAAALVLKYVMPLQKEEVKSDDSRIINVVHSVSLPDTILGEAVESELAMLPPGVEAFEADYPLCYVCHERKHPDTGRPTGTGWMCKACSYRESVRVGKNNQTTDTPQTHSLTGD